MNLFHEESNIPTLGITSVASFYSNNNRCVKGYSYVSYVTLLVG